MIGITSAKSKIWSKMGARAVFGMAMLELAGQRDDVVVLSADLVTSSGLDRFKKTYPDRCINVGIAEQNLIGIASGLAHEGATVFATSFAPFISMRAGEQIRMNMGYMEMNVKAVGIGSGLAMAHLGNSHYGLEDISVMRSIPNITVLCPADGAEIFQAVFAAAEIKGPVYIRLTGGVNNPIIYDGDYEFEIGKSIRLRDGGDLTIITNGAMAHQSLAAADILQKEGISASVINMHTVKPLDCEAVKVAAINGPIVTVEEHSVIGGLGSAVAEYKSTLKNALPQLFIGLPDKYGKSGDYEYLIDTHGLTGEKIAAKIKEFCRNDGAI
ncbi:MAG: transketolase family protein [Synergistaceae bacterium]|jgi:transketolase|nr:transketolase family protein [Synergistaceae bacterium]